jgi:hypothetical protein
MLRRRLDKKKKIEDKSDVQLTKTHFKKVKKKTMSNDENKKENKKKNVNPCTPIKLVTCHLTSNKLGKTLKLNF